MLTTKVGPFTAIQAIVLAAAFVVAAGGAFAFLRITDDRDASTLAADEQLVPAQIGDLVSLVSTDGALVFPESESAVFETSGTIGEILVEEGAIVREGQPLARLDAASVADLDRRVARAQLDLQKVVEDLEEETAVANPLDVAKAKSSLAKAIVSLQVAQDDLNELQAEADASDVAKAESSLAKAIVSLQVAQDDLNELQAEADASDIAKAESSLAKAALSQQNAVDKLAELVAGATTDEIANAEAAIAADETELVEAEARLALVVRVWDTRIATAQSSLDDAVTGYEEMFAKWLGVDAALVDTNAAPADLLAGWGADLDVIFVDSADTPNLALKITPPADDPATAWSETAVYSYLAFSPFPIVGTCEDVEVPREGACVLLDLEDAWDTLLDQRDNFGTVTLEAVQRIANDESRMIRDQSSLKNEQDELANLLEDADPLEIDVAKAELAVARTNREDALTSLNELTMPALDADIAAETAELAVAQANVTEAQAALAGLTAEPDQATVELLQAELAVAQANVTEAQAALADLTAEPDQATVELLQTETLTAELALVAAVVELEGATLLAPLGGEVLSVDLEAGQNATGNQAGGVLIVDRSVVELEGTVDEIDILAIDIGVTADVTMTALPGQTLRGTVIDIGTPTNQQGVVTFPVSVLLEVPDGLDLLEGLTATASITISQIRDVLMVPTASVQGSFVAPFVRVANGDSLEERAVELGASDDFWVIVRSGLDEGEQVAMPAPDSELDGLNNFAVFGGGGRAALRALQGGGGQGGRSQRGGGGGGGQGGGGRGNN